jgi:rhodanese-related sulfurtransferase
MKKFFILALLLIILIVGGSVYFMDNLSSQATFVDITPAQFSQDLKSGGFTLIDVRTLDEYNAGHIKNAQQSDYYQTQAFTSFLGSLDKKGKYLIYCRTGKRSSLVMQMMRDMGFVSVSDLAGGYNAWVSSGLPVEK